MPSPKVEARQRWMAEYQRLVILKNPTMAGRIDWDTAAFLFNEGLTPEQAAKKTTEG